MIDLVPVKVHTVFMQQSDDTAWCDFIIPVLNVASFDIPRGQRIGQRLMNALNEREPLMAGLTTADIRFDIWEVDDPNDPRIEAFAERVFELFLEKL